MKKSREKIKICVVSSSRADYGILKSAIKKFYLSPKFSLQLVATGSHLSEIHGNSISEILQDGIEISDNVDLLLERDDPCSISSYMALAQKSFAQIFARKRPDTLLVLGDRYEVLSAALAALVENIPVIHIHGGEITRGAIDDSIRHCITKLSHLHFVCHREYGNRIIQMGEDPDSVHNIGSLGVEAINKMKLYTRNETQNLLNFRFFEKNLVVTYHPETLGRAEPTKHLEALFSSLRSLKDTSIIFTSPGADHKFNSVIAMIKSFVSEDIHTRKYFDFLGQKLFFSAINFSSGVVGNSSSGILEAPSLKVGTVNIGERQNGRIFADSVICCKARKDQIDAAFDELFSEKFSNNLKLTINPFDQSNSSDRLVEIIERFSFNTTQKLFHDIKF
jgi:GDP/UDP-N,N'-diacetylbacillosamine 2-epimerase (hydrolysing)